MPVDRLWFLTTCSKCGSVLGRGGFPNDLDRCRCGGTHFRTEARDGPSSGPNLHLREGARKRGLSALGPNGVTVICDRCGVRVSGLEIPGIGTSGFYKVGPGTFWSKFARPGESIVCDGCMHGDPAYRGQYRIETMPHGFHEARGSGE